MNNGSVHFSQILSKAIDINRESDKIIVEMCHRIPLCPQGCKNLWQTSEKEAVRIRSAYPAAITQ